MKCYLSILGATASQHHDSAFCCIQKFNRNSGSRCFYNGLPEIVGRLLHAYLHPLSGADELMETHHRLLLLFIMQVMMVWHFACGLMRSWPHSCCIQSAAVVEFLCNLVDMYTMRWIKRGVCSWQMSFPLHINNNVLWGCLLETSSFSNFSLHEHTCHLADCSQKWCVGSEQPDFRLICEFQVCLQIIMAKTRLVLFLGYLKEWDVNQWCHHDHTGALCFSGHLPEWHNWYCLPLVNCTFELVCFWDFAIDSLHCNSG